VGIFVFGSFFSGIVGGMVPGIAGLLFFRWVHNEKERGTWERYILCACIGFLVLAGVGLLKIPAAPSGAPSGAAYADASSAAFLLGVAPGGSLLLGCVAALPELDT
jgi:hypothetical protein